MPYKESILGLEREVVHLKALCCLGAFSCGRYLGASFGFLQLVSILCDVRGGVDANLQQKGRHESDMPHLRRQCH